MLNERKSAINNLTNLLLFYGTSIFCYHGEGDFATTRRNVKKPMRKHRLFFVRSQFGTSRIQVENK